jgi:endonuclease-3
MADPDCERFLCALPGIGKKAARCIMMYSLDRAVFPVDSHCWRISQRLGWANSNTRSGFCTSNNMDRLQEVIPKKLRQSRHVNMVLFSELIRPNLPD